MMINGTFTLKDEHDEYAAIGYELSRRLGINLNMIKPIKIVIPNRNATPSPTNPDAISIRQILMIKIGRIFLFPPIGK